MPVVVNMAHEAKPHLPGAALMLCAIFCATNYVRTGHRRHWVGAGALCGAAFVYGGIIEVGIGSVPTQLHRISMVRHVIGIMQPLLGGGSSV